MKVSARGLTAIADGLTVNVTAPLVPPNVLTVTLAAPVAAFAAIVKEAVICVGLTTVTLLTTTPALSTLTVAPEVKLVPVRVTETVAPWTPFDGLMDVKVGTTEPTVKDNGPLVPPGVVTVTLVGPAAAVVAMVNVAVI